MSDAGFEITNAIRAADGRAICSYVVGGYPTMAEFDGVLAAVAAESDLVEVGVPFSDPMADGLTIQQAGYDALAAGASLPAILEVVARVDVDVPVVLMGYYNPFLALGLGELAEALEGSRVAGLIVPDLPLEESGPLSAALGRTGRGLVQMVAPTTPKDRLGLLASSSHGFVYAVTTRGTTGGTVGLGPELWAHLRRVKTVSSLPVLAGFGVREPSHVEAFRGHVDGVVVGSALVDVIGGGGDPGAFIRTLRSGSTQP